MVDEDDTRELARNVAAECLVLRVRRLSRRITRIYDEALRPYGLKAAQYNLLVAIAIAGPVQPRVLAEELELEKSSLSRTMQRLVDTGWVERVGRGRGQSLKLSESGRDLLQEAHEAWEIGHREVTRQLGPDARGLFDRLVHRRPD